MVGAGLAGLTPKIRFEPADGRAPLCGLAVEIDDATGLAVRTAALRLGGVLSPVELAFWRATSGSEPTPWAIG